MKIIIDHTPKAPETKFPVLMKLKPSFTDHDVIVYFTAPKIGITMQHPEYPFGKSRQDWTDMNNWMPFNGQIILSN